MKTTLMIIALLMLAGSALAVSVDPNATDGVAAYMVSGSYAYVLCTDGTVFRIQEGWDAWVLVEDQLPVSVHEIAEWNIYFLRTSTGVTWGGSPSLSSDDWHLVPSVPCSGAVSSQQESIGNVKSQYR